MVAKAEASDEQFVMEIMLVEWVIENEISLGLSQKQIAQTYAMALAKPDQKSVDYARMNAAIVKRWPKGLNRVKEMAWKIYESRGAWKP